MEKSITRGFEDLLEAIVVLEGEEEKITVSNIAKKLKISKPSVVEMLKRLSKKGYIKQEKYGKPALTEKGREMGLHVQLHHKIIYKFLRECLKVSPSIAELEACKMEHALSCKTIHKLEDYIKKHEK